MRRRSGNCALHRLKIVFWAKCAPPTHLDRMAPCVLWFRRWSEYSLRVSCESGDVEIGFSASNMLVFFFFFFLDLRPTISSLPFLGWGVHFVWGPCAIALCMMDPQKLYWLGDGFQFPVNFSHTWGLVWWWYCNTHAWSQHGSLVFPWHLLLGKVVPPNTIVCGLGGLLGGGVAAMW
jgi:hypothetical protein